MWEKLESADLTIFCQIQESIGKFLCFLKNSNTMNLKIFHLFGWNLFEEKLNFILHAPFVDGSDTFFEDTKYWHRHFNKKYLIIT